MEIKRDDLLGEKTLEQGITALIPDLSGKLVIGHVISGEREPPVKGSQEGLILETEAR